MEIYKNIYCHKIPLPGNPLQSINNFIVKSGDENLIIDTAFNVDASIAAMKQVVKSLDINLQKTKLFITHFHSDHSGQAHLFAARGAKIFMGETDGHLVSTMANPQSPHWNEVLEIAKLQGLGQEKLTIQEHPGYKYRPQARLEFSTIYPGDKIVIGQYSFTAINLAGHTPGMLGLYEPNHKILFCGDHVLGSITPNITFYGFRYGDMLGQYMENLRKVSDMEIKLLLSSHRALIPNYRDRIAELLNHHQKRLDETYEILNHESPMTVLEVTKKLHWNISSKNWDAFPKSQKWFAAGEAHAHLEHLLAVKKIQRTKVNGILYYYI